MAVAPLSLDDVRQAADRIAPYILKTPTVSAEPFTGSQTWLKLESLQRTGSFKLRGAINAVLQLSAEQRRRGVITLSAGNHGAALAYAAQSVGIPCVVVVREDAAISKLRGIRRYGAEVVLVPIGEWQHRLEEEQERRGLHLVHPFDDPAVVAGQGTVGLEILESLPEVAAIIVPVGGGGLISGIATAVKESRPTVRVIGVEPAQAPVVTESLQAGRPVAPSRLDTIADGLAAPYTRPLTLGIIQRYVDQVRTISDASISEAVRALALNAKLVAEPAGAAGVAAVVEDPSISSGAVVMVTGGNIDAGRLSSMLTEKENPRVGTPGD